jgi:hypothetical protein
METTQRNMAEGETLIRARCERDGTYRLGFEGGL